MNKDIVEARWKQMRAAAKDWWGELTDDDLDRAAGKFDILTGMFQEKYGYSRKRAADAVGKRVAEYEASLEKRILPAFTN